MSTWKMKWSGYSIPQKSILGHDTHDIHFLLGSDGWDVVRVSNALMVMDFFS